MIRHVLACAALAMAAIATPALAQAPPEIGMIVASSGDVSNPHSTLAAALAPAMIAVALIGGSGQAPERATGAGLQTTNLGRGLDPLAGLDASGAYRLHEDPGR